MRSEGVTITYHPGNRAGFLRICENKRALFGMLASSRTERASVNKQLVNTISDLVLSSSSTSEASSLQPCSNDEADARIILNISYCATDGMTRMIVRTTDTDVMSSCHPSTVFKRSMQRQSGFHVVSGRSSATVLHTRLLLSLGHVLHQRCQCLMPSRRATPSFLAGKGNGRAWKVWQAYPEAKYIFPSLFSGPDA